MRILNAVLAALVCAGAAHATDHGQRLIYGGAGQGKVVFDGQVHASKGMVCKDCHPARFATRKQALITMADHEGTTKCFGCHDGKRASNTCVSCHRDPALLPPKPTLTYEGATTIGKGIMPEAAKRFQALTGVAFTFIGEAGAEPGFKAAVAGTAVFGGVARELSAAERAQVAVAETIAFDVMAVFVHPANGVKGLTRAQLKSVFTGQVVNWKELGGADVPVTIYSEKLNGGRATVKAFKDMVLGKEPYGKVVEFDDAPDCLVEVAKDRGGISASSMSFATPQVATLDVDGAAPTKAGVQSGRYPLKRPLILVSKAPATGPAKAFLEFILSAEGQVIVGKKFVPAR
jgi:phosphate transport system substrate-binding protein